MNVMCRVLITGYYCWRKKASTSVLIYLNEVIYWDLLLINNNQGIHGIFNLKSIP